MHAIKQHLFSFWHSFWHSPYVQEKLRRASLSDPKNQQILAIILAVFMALVIIFSIGYSWLQAALAPEDTRNYSHIPFDEYDATNMCTAEMENRLGDSLLRSYVDGHSTRLDNRKGLYRVYMVADVGELNDYHEVMVYCFIDKWDHDLSYYKEVDPDNKPILSTDLKFFSN